MLKELIRQAKFEIGEIAIYHGAVTRVLGSAWHPGSQTSTYTLGAIWNAGQRAVWHTNASEDFMELACMDNVVDIAR